MATVRVAVVVVGYLLGTLPVAQLIARRTGHDPTREGSGNPGASNVFRTAGRRAGTLVLAGDLFKGAAATGLGWVIGGRFVALLAGCAAVLGHVVPLTRDLRGGKGVATSGGVVLVLHPLALLAGVVTWIAVATTTKVAAAASLAAVVVVTGVVVVLGAPVHEVVVLVALMVVVVVRHRGNIARMMSGRERTLEAGSH
jgi:glycerol-3-phosphate acyltransferase PlsY